MTPSYKEGKRTIWERKLTSLYMAFVTFGVFKTRQHIVMSISSIFLIFRNFPGGQARPGQRNAQDTAVQGLLSSSPMPEFWCSILYFELDTQVRNCLFF